GRAGPRAHPRSHFDGHPASRGFGPAGDALDQGRPGAEDHSHHRGHRFRHEGRRGEDPAGRLRSLSLEAHFRGEVSRHRGKLSEQRARGRGPMTARVLVVDDILPNIKLLEARLTAEYFDVISATSGLEAIEIAREGRCDVVLLDVMMPGMDGFEACRRLKADPLTLHVPVVMVTALDQPADRVRGLMAGADDF